jgi:ATP-dependent protease Clp ATPase subunit
VRILTEPDESLTDQYQALLGPKGVKLEFTEDGIGASPRSPGRSTSAPRTSAPAGCTR